MTRLSILTCCLILSGALAAQTQPLDQQPILAQHATGDSQKYLADRAAMDVHGEWWQLTASLTDRDGRAWSLEWTLHRRQAGPRGVGDAQPADAMSLAHVSITTPDGIYLEQNFVNREISATDAAALSENANYADQKPGWEWVSKGEALLPARLSFSVGEHDINLLLEASDAAGAAESAAAGRSSYVPSVRVRGFVDRGASKTYLRGIGRLDREGNSPVLIGKPSVAGQPVTRNISSASD